MSSEHKVEFSTYRVALQSLELVHGAEDVVNPVIYMSKFQTGYLDNKIDKKILASSVLVAQLPG